MVFWFVEVLVAASLQVGLAKLVDFGTGASAPISDLDEQLQKLKRNLVYVQTETILNDAQRTRAWEDLAFEASDLLDDIEIAVSKLEASNLDVSVPLVPRLDRKQAQVNRKQAQVNRMQAQLDDVLGNLRRHFEKARQQHSQSTSRPQTTSVPEESHVFGRETAKADIISILASTCYANNVSIIPILGMVGVGKTTLAQLVFNEESLPFDMKLWVSMYQDFDVMKLTSSIIEAANGETTSHLLNLDSLQRKLTKVLGDKKFLLVLDDLWHENREQLAQLLRPLRDGSKGSKIIVTTRSEAVVSSLKAATVSPLEATEPYPLMRLSDDDCWLILKHQAFGNVELDIDRKLETIGIEIARKCKGFPLAAISLGRLLSQRPEQVLWWNDILETQIWSGQSGAVGELKSRLCDHLPSHLKDCFAYCSIFPPRHDLERDKLFRMWMGEGFIAPSEDNLETQSLDQLFRMTIFELGVGVETYQMNEAIQDLALVVYGQKFFRMEETSNSASISRNTRYLSLMSDKIIRREMLVEAAYNSKGLRTFLLFGKCDTILKQVRLFQKLEHLRVLDLSSSQLEELADGIGNLKHLRFLDLSNTFLKLLPDDLHKLVLLQTLRLLNCSQLFYLPKGISMLKRLQHLELGRDSRLTCMPTGIGKLITLQTLDQFIVGPGGGQLAELKDMNSIRGSLCIKQLEKVRNPTEAQEANLANKRIEELELQWTSPLAAAAGSVQVGRNLNHDLVLGSLMTGPQGHSTLKKLTLLNYGGTLLPGWVSDKSSKLTSVFLKDCKFCRVLPPLGQLPNLKYLKIEGMDELTEVGVQFCGETEGFKALKTLEFRRMPKLMAWTGLRDTDMAQLRELVIAKCHEMNILPTLLYLQCLEELEFESCPKLSSLPELSSSIEKLTIIDCNILNDRCKQGGADWTKIMPIPDVEIDYKTVSRTVES